MLGYFPEILNKKSKLLSLEGVRFACAFSILVLHYINLVEFFPQLDAPTVFRNPLLEKLRFFFGFGSWAVPVFWMLSGYIFYYQYAEKVYTRKVRGSEFFLLRFSRLYPLHLATLLGVGVLQFILQTNGLAGVEPNNNLENFIKQLFFVSNWGMNPVRSFNGPVWSVSTEVLVYAFFFILVSRYGNALWPIVLNLGWSVVLNKGKSFEGGFVECVLFFFAGAMGYLAAQKILQTPPGKKYFALVLTVLLSWPLVGWGMGWMSAPKTFLLTFGPAFLVALARVPLPSKGKIEAVLEEMGNLTYSSYMLHFGINLLVCGVIAKFSISPQILGHSGFVGCYFVGMLFLSSLCYHGFERPLQEFIRKRWVQRAPAESKSE